jgi:hypothetical protein
MGVKRHLGLWPKRDFSAPIVRLTAEAASEQPQFAPVPVRLVLGPSPFSSMNATPARSKMTTTVWVRFANLQSVVVVFPRCKPAEKSIQLNLRLNVGYWVRPIGDQTILICRSCAQRYFVFKRVGNCCL